MSQNDGVRYLGNFWWESDAIPCMVEMSCDNKPTERPCDVCGSTHNRFLFDKEGYAHVRCVDCGLVFVDPIPENHRVVQTDSGTGLMGDDSLTHAQEKRLNRELKLIERFRKNSTLLEIGPGRGWFVIHGKKSGWETWAVEINKEAFKRLQTSGLDNVIHCAAEDMNVPSDYFDVVRMWDVIEHLRSPSTVIRAIERCLRPGGYLRLSTTNFASLSRLVNGPDWVYLNGSDHIHLFEPATIRFLLMRTGFTDIRVQTRSFNLRRKRYHPEKVLSPRFHPLSPLRKIIDELIRLTPYGHQMIVTAQKGS